MRGSRSAVPRSSTILSTVPTRARATVRGALILLGLAAAWPTHAGQVRVDVGSAGLNVFTPDDVTLRPGDHVVWVWRDGFHSVTSGDSTACQVFTGDGRFESGTVNTNAQHGTQFSWRSTGASGVVAYVCLPHCAEMRAVLRFVAGAPVADFRITEVQTNASGELDLIEITNFGAAAGNLGRYRFATSDTATVPVDDFLVPAGARVTVHLNQAGPQDAPDHLFLPTQSGLPDSGYVALYVPNTVRSSLADSSQIIDFVQWGAAGSTREGTAVAAGLWTAGAFVPRPAAGHSLEFCGAAGDRGRVFWSEVAVPNFGVDGDCATPSVPITWGRLKTIYR
jgi:plastocyanin